MPEHKLEYKLEIDFKTDGVKIISTGEGIQKIENLNDSITRHRHTKLINDINDLIRNWSKSNNHLGYGQ